MKQFAVYPNPTSSNEVHIQNSSDIGKKLR
jgi:hypothetical protein